MTKLLEDILRQPDELLGSLAYATGDGSSALREAARVVDESDHVFVTGIGSSWHAGMAVQARFDAAGRPCRLVDASELVHYAPFPPNTALIALSRSGRSVEIVESLPKARAAGTRVIAVTNTPDSPLADQADVTLRLEAAFDHQVSVTMYSALTLVGGLIASCDRTLTDGLAGGLEAARDMLPEWRERIEDAAWFDTSAPTYFLARGGSRASCYETRLMWEEAAKAPATALGTGSFRHGPQEVVTDALRVGLWLDPATLHDADLELVRDLRSLGTKVMLIGADVPDEAADLVMPVPHMPCGWQFLVDIMPAQLAAEHLSRLRGVDCDAFLYCPYIIESEGGL